MAMNDKHLHIVSFDVPYPANYGGVIDVFHRIRALANNGVAVHLHCYDYGRGRQQLLEEMCAEVRYYERDMSFARQLSSKPFIVASRCNAQLVDDLLSDGYPVLCEGLHTTSIVADSRLSNRKIYVRAHNVEHDYYRLLAASERNPLRRLYFNVEAWRLRRYEPILAKVSGVFAISQSDADYFSGKYPNVMFVPGFSAFDAVRSKTGKGDYVLYHGNLSVAENADAAEWLLLNVFSRLDFACVIAGLNPSRRLEEAVAKVPNVRLVANPTDEAMAALIADAQVNVLVTHQPTGMKLKLLNALYNGRHCLANPAMLTGTTLDGLCCVASDAETMRAEVAELFARPFCEADIALREQGLAGVCDNNANALKIIGAIEW